MQEFDNIIIGAGPGGYELAAALSHKGESVLVVERDKLGGTCLNRGCIPTKALCASVNAVLNARFAPVLGVDTGDVSVDYGRVVARMAEVVGGLREGVAGLLGGCEVVNGDAEFCGPKTIKIGEEKYTARRIVIATGSTPAVLNIPGAELAMTSDDALWMDTLPSSIVVIGGGVIGMELASIFNALGTKVTVVEFCKEILPTVDPEIAKRLRTTMSRRGIDIICGAAVEKIDREGDTLQVTYAGKKGVVTVGAERVVMAVGRRPVVPRGFEGEITPKGFIKVDGLMQTSIAGVYAVGDVNGLLMLAHAAYAQGRVVLHADAGMFNADNVPSVVFTSPEVASVGPSAEDLAGRGQTFHVVKRLFASNGKACADGHSEGVVKFLVSDVDNTVLAVTIIGHHASELITEAAVFVTDRVDVSTIASHYIHPHPTLSEIFAI